jgi:acyl-CoA reductase-like NAD-dependent aldehyde dehydrogenase
VTSEVRTQYIAGQWTEPVESHRITTVDPTHPNRVIGRGEAASSERVREALVAARRAGTAWQLLDPLRRAASLGAVAAALESHQDEIAKAIVMEVGKPIREARAEVAVAVAVARFYAQHQLMASGSSFPTEGSAVSFTSRHPLGVVAVISPFNFPLAIPAWKILPAIAYGNAVIWKPTSSAFEVASRVTEIIGDVLPPGLIGTILGGADSVNALLDQGIDGVSFTGSTTTGLALAAKCAGAAVPIQAEMGGKNATTILADADLERAAAGCVAAAFSYAGQKCTATSRLLVQQSAWDRFLGHLEDAMKAVVVGDPADEATSVGPVISKEQAARLHDTERTATARIGNPLVARRVTGAEGFFADLVVLGPAESSDPISQEELFGPLVVAIPVEDVAEAIAVNNSVRYGLSASIYTASLDSALRFARGAACGIVRTNRTTTGLDYALPFGGEGRSGLGSKELGAAAQEFYTRSRTIWIG